MKKNNKGFFLAETIIVLALVTTVMAFVYPNVSKLYENYSSRINTYDQTEDLLVLKQFSEIYREQIEDFTKENCGGADRIIGTSKFKNTLKRISNKNWTNEEQFIKAVGSPTIYITNYINNGTKDSLDFKRYLNRMRKVTYDINAYRLIGVFDGGKRYASIKFTPSSYCGITQ